MKLWALTLTGPIAWFVALLGSFIAQPPGCFAHNKILLFVIPGICLLATAAAAFLSWLDWNAAGREYPGDSGGRRAATRTMASGGVLLNGIFVIVIIAQFVAPSIYGACQ